MENKQALDLVLTYLSNVSKAHVVRFSYNDQTKKGIIEFRNLNDKLKIKKFIIEGGNYPFVDISECKLWQKSTWID